jgi:actin-related protein
MSSAEQTYLRPLIADFGSSTFRFGWAGGDFPEILTPSIYVDASDYIFDSDVVNGLEEIFIGDNRQEYLFGDNALKYQNILKIHEFIKEENYNILEKYFLFHYEKLNIPDEYRFMQPIIIISPFNLTDIIKAKLKNIFFEKFEFPFLLFLPDDKAILSTLRKSDGVIINMGENNTYISSIYHGFTNIMARDVFPIAGEELTNYFLNMILKGRASSRNFYLDYWLAKEIKEKMSICVQNPKKEKERIKEGLTKYNRVVKLPDNSKLKINYERFMISEPLFDPKLVHIDYMSLPEVIAKIVRFWDRKNWADLLSNVILSGGGSLIPGLKDRLQFELRKHFSDKLKDQIKVFAASGRENMAWIGGSVLFGRDKLEGWIKNPRLEEGSIEQGECD